MVKRNSADTLHPEAVHRLSQFLGKLPGIGRKSAQRLAYELLSWERTELKAFGELLQELPSLVHRCQRCGIFSDSQVCSLCRDPERDSSLICVVEDIREVVALEQAETFRGTYHILGGKLSPLDGVGPEQLRIAQLLERVQTGEVREIILALSSDVEGEATAAYVTDTLRTQHPEVQVTRIGRGVPVGSDLSYADPATLATALELRRPVS